MSKLSPPRLIKFGNLLGAMLLSANIYAGDIQVENAWARASAPSQDFAMLDLTIVSKQDATLVGVSSIISKNVALHSMTHENGMMKMREVKTIKLPAGKRVNLGESGYHLMLNGLKAPIKAGETVPLILTIAMPGDRTEQIATSAEVRPLTAARIVPQEGGHMQHHH